MNEKKFIFKYLEDTAKLISPDIETISKLEKIKKLFLSVKKNQKKLIIIGNGGSAGIASHFSVDMTKNGKIRCINFNESSLITCLTNDFSYDKVFSKAIDYYGDKGDILIAISSSGTSPNILNACNQAKIKKFSKIITFSGFPKKSKLKKIGDVNLLVNSQSYNFIENVHQIWLLLLVDLIIGKTQYKVN